SRVSSVVPMGAAGMPPSRPRFERAARMTVAAAILVVSTASLAEQPRNLDLPKFDPAPAGDRFFGVPSAYTPGNAVVHLGILLDYAHDPLILADASGKTSARIVEHQLLLHLNGTFMLFGRLQ